ncbi:MAG: GNAT family N-acetyltransferase [Gemmatimonadota bacterium]
MTPDSFLTARLRCDRLTRDHLPELRRMDQNAEMMATVGGIRTAQQTVAYLDFNLTHWADHGFGVWIARELGTDAIVGRTILRYLRLEDKNEIEVGYGLYPAYWGRGLATEMAGACVQMGFTLPAVQSLIGLTLPTNQASRRVLEKVGFGYEGAASYEGLSWMVYRAERPTPKATARQSDRPVP